MIINFIRLLLFLPLYTLNKFLVIYSKIISLFDPNGQECQLEELRGKLMGYYVDKQLNVNKNSYDDMTPEQLEDRMKMIIDEYQHILKVEEPNGQKI